MSVRLTRSAVVIAVTLTTVFATTQAANASHGSFTTSAGIYRVPYANGTDVTANNDHHSHPNAFDRVDLAAGEGSTIVAAASGIIRGIRDMNGDSFGRGDGLAADGVTANDDDEEHECLDDADVVGDCTDYNNYVWIEHPNGEWTKYTHFQTGSVTIDNGWSVGDTIFVGQVLGTEGDVGSASGPHLHFEVAAVPRAAAPHRSARSAASCRTAGTSSRSSALPMVTTTATVSTPRARATRRRRA